MKKPLLILFLLVHGMLQAQDNLLTLQEAVESGLQRNPGLRELYSVLDQKRNAARQETGINDPEVSYFR